MRAYDIAAKESKFATTLTDSSGFKWSSTVGIFNYCKLLYGKKDHFIGNVIRKQRIVLHETFGILQGDIAQLTTNTVSVPFVIARDGTVYQLFDPEYCAYHLGPPSKGSGDTYSNKDMSFSSIGIELSGIGPLTAKGNTLVDIYGQDYCLLTDTDYYTKTDFRGYKYYTNFTSAQLKSLDTLLLDLCRKYNIVHSFVPPEERFTKDVKAAQQAGISCHANWRQDKSDIAPNLDFSLISGE